LKTGLRNNRLFLPVLSSLILAGWSILFSEPVEWSEYIVNADNQLLVSVVPGNLNESRLKSNILNSGKSEIIMKFRVKIESDDKDVSLPQVNEVNIRKSGYRDIITGDYVLQVNGREAGSFREWDLFYRRFSEMEAFPLDLFLSPGESPTIRYRMEVVYKKFVTPLNLLYLIPGKYITRGRWEIIQPQSYRD